MSHPSPIPAQPRTPPRILVVDDEESIRFALREYLTLQGYDVETVAERDEAQARLERVAYDVLIVDLRLDPERPMGGLDLVRLARRRLPETPIVMLTAHGSPEVRREAFESGVDAFLTKPSRLKDVAKILADLLPAPPPPRRPSCP